MISVLSGILILAVIMILILKSQMLPGNIMAMVPIIGALVIGTSFPDTMLMVHEGISDVLVIVALFMFATIFFGIMSDAGLFDPIIRVLMKKTGNSVFGVVLVAALIATVSHLDGQGVTTLIVTIPPMIIVFDKLKIRRTLLALVFMTVIPMMNMIPWGGPTARASAVIGEDVMVLYKAILPIQIVGLVLSVIILFIASRQEESRGEFVSGRNISFSDENASEEENNLRRPKLFWVNLVLTVIVVVALFVGVPSYIAFLIGSAIVLPLNYRTVKEQRARVKAHSGNILIAAYTIVGAGALLGIMSGLGMFEAIAKAFVSVVPESLDNIIHIIIGLFITPLGYLLSADALLYGVMPVVINIGAQYGISAITITAMFDIGHCVATTLCLTTPSVYVGLGLMKLEYRDVFKANFKWSLLLGTVLVILTAIFVG